MSECRTEMWCPDMGRSTKIYNFVPESPTHAAMNSDARRVPLASLLLFSFRVFLASHGTRFVAAFQAFVEVFLAVTADTASHLADVAKTSVALPGLG